MEDTRQQHMWHKNIIKVLQWNCRGLRSRVAELRARFQDKPDEKPDVLLVQEANAHDINLRGFILYSSPSISNNRPGQSADPPGKALVYIKED